MIRFLKLLLVFVAIDAIWLALMTSRFYEVQLGEMLRPDPNLLIGSVAWVLMAFGSEFLVQPTAEPAKNGFILGVTAYGLYNFTNMATLTNWSPTVVVIDTLWGGTLSALVNHIVSLT